MKIRSILLAAVIAAVPVLASAQQPAKTATVVEKEKGAVAVADAIELQGTVTASTRTRGQSLSWEPAER